MEAEEAAKGPNAFLAAWNDLCERLRRTQTEPWMQRLGVALRAWIANARIETANAEVYQRTGKLPSCATMLDIRTVSIGMYPTFYLLEMAEGFELPESVHEHATVVELKRLASRLVGYGNDLGGLAKDLAGNWPNLVTAYEKEHGVSTSEAFDAVAALHNREVETFDAVAKTLPSWGPDLDVEVEQWVQAIRYSVLGFTFWESLATRDQKWQAQSGNDPLVAPVSVFTPAGAAPGDDPTAASLRTRRLDP